MHSIAYGNSDLTLRKAIVGPAEKTDKESKCSSARLAFMLADVEPELASFMADSQVLWGVDALSWAVLQPWKTKPSYCLVATEDRMIPPPAQRAMAGRAKAQVPGSHAVYVSKPADVADIIQQAAVGAE